MYLASARRICTLLAPIMKNVWFIAFADIRHQLRQGSTLVWLLVMPPVFFYFIGTVTGGFSAGARGGIATPLTVIAEAPGFLKDQVDLRLRDNDFAPTWVASLEIAEGDEGDELRRRTLTIDSDFSARILADETVDVTFATQSNALTRQFEEIRIQRVLYTVLADIVVADASSAGTLDAAALVALNGTERVWQLDVSPAGKKQDIPTGFEQAVPGTLVMFTLLILLTSGASMLVLERQQGLLRRMASAPISKSELVAGKWIGRMALAAMQVSVALAIGTFLFQMNWGPFLPMIIVVLAAWAGFCASAGLWLGTVAGTQAQASGLGVLTANALAALGGCWWPIEITPDWMQALQKLLPTGWTMDALHKLISFQSGALSALPNVIVLLIASGVVAWLATRRFRYQ